MVKFVVEEYFADSLRCRFCVLQPARGDLKQLLQECFGMCQQATVKCESQMKVHTHFGSKAAELKLLAGSCSAAGKHKIVRRISVANQLTEKSMSLKGYTSLAHELVLTSN